MLLIKYSVERSESFMKKMLKFTQSEYIEVSKRFKKYCLSAEQMEADIVTNHFVQPVVFISVK